MRLLRHRQPLAADTWYSSFTAWTTRVSNPVCSPRFRASASVIVQQAAFATGVPPDIYAFHRYTRNSACPSDTLAGQFPMQSRGWAPGFHIRLALPPALPLHPVNPDNACTIRITAAAGTYLAGASSAGTVAFFPADRALHTEILLRSRGVAASGFPPLCNIPHCCLP